MINSVVKNGTFDKNGHKYDYQVRSDGFHLVWGHGLVHYRDQFKVDDTAHKMMEKVKGRSVEAALQYFERLINNNASTN